MPEVTISNDVLGLCVAALNRQKQTIIDDLAMVDSEGQKYLLHNFVNWLLFSKVEIESEADFYGINRSKWYLLHNTALLCTKRRMQ